MAGARGKRAVERQGLRVEGSGRGVENFALDLIRMAAIASRLVRGKGPGVWSSWLVMVRSTFPLALLSPR
jgi:hypothetical protein